MIAPKTIQLKEQCNIKKITNWKNYVKVAKHLFRPAEVDFLIGDSGKAQKALDWKPSVTFPQLVKMMVEADIALLSKNSQ